MMPALANLAAPLPAAHPPPVEAQGCAVAEVAIEFEAYPPEIRLLVSEEWLRWPLADNPLLSQDLWNSRLQQTFHEPIAASMLMLALSLARDPTELRQALDALADAPHRYLGECWDQALAWFCDWIGRNHDPRPLVLLGDLLDRLPPVQPLRLQLLHRLADLARRPRFGDRAGVADRLLKSCAELPDIPASLWRMLMQLQRRALKDPLRDRHPIEQIPGVDRLPAARREALALLQRCGGRARHAQSAQALQLLIRQVEAVEDPAIRFELLELLRARPERGEEPCAEFDLASVTQALLRVPGAAWHAKALRMLSLDELELTPRQLMQELGELAPVHAIRVLAMHIDTPVIDADDRQAMADGLIALLQRSREEPCGHLQFLHGMSYFIHRLGQPAVMQRLQELAMEDCTRVDPRYRLALLAVLEPGARCGGDVRQLWKRHWLTALAQVSGTLRQARNAAQAWPAIQGLLPALRQEENRDAVLRLQIDALPLLPAQDQARVLEQMLTHCLRSRFDTDEAHRVLLIEACRRLPFHLRAGPLRCLRRFCATAPQASVALLTALQRDTTQAQAAWAENSLAVLASREPA
ncbi:hypothetical protein GT347_15795 [Xylophilus rhododendri]|uniref:Uncharacterized protein n=1 Tax=Xylophilus rhododendri TaxID=2697032 RepID=A0A857J8C9_9BURK|nr:hypothetical protein [Xylophilus rhododendri]QHI99309.1 hypothetical protein GT347_15795 [Xylophilus rhododendri]